MRRTGLAGVVFSSFRLAAAADTASIGMTLYDELDYFLQRNLKALISIHGNFFINLRDFFYTRATKNPGWQSFDYRLSMSALFVLHYMALWIILDKVLKRVTHGFSLIGLLRAGDLLPKMLTTIAFFSPLAIVMFWLFKELKKYEIIRMDKVEGKKWLFVAIAIGVSGVMALMILPRFVSKILN